MSTLFKKLNLKDETDLLVVNAPASFEPELAALEGVTVHRDADSLSAVAFALAFVTHPEQVDVLAPAIAGKARGDALLWFAYPKKSSKRYRSEITRDQGWQTLGSLGFEPVRQVAVDEDWSALRFRRVEFIKTIRRDPGMALSAEGKQRAAEE